MNDFDDTASSLAPVLTVAQLNQRVRTLLEGGFPLLWVRGEISNLSFAPSGHVYFTLKDAQAQVGCVMFRSRAQLLGFRPEGGQRVDARARVTLFEAGGRYQLQIESLRPAGQGDLHARFLALRDRLAAEGLFDPASKRILPSMPRRIGIITSPRAAALRDVVTTLRRRAPQMDLVVYPAAVQGEDAPRQLVAALKTADQRGECELLILCRGGGSLEDLWCFNDETLARTLRALATPVVCGVGHETDFTIADFAADLRAPTPTAAAELSSPDTAALLQALKSKHRRLQFSLEKRLQQAAQQLDQAARRLRHPAEKLRQARKRLRELVQRMSASVARRQRESIHGFELARRRYRRLGVRERLVARASATLTQLAERLSRIHRSRLDQRRVRLEQLAARLRALNPGAVLERGYAVVSTADGRVIADATGVELNSRIYVNLRNGCLESTVNNKTPPQWPPED